MIAALVAEGLSNPEIAVELRISRQTVKNHLRSIYRKVGVWSRLELAAWLFNRDCKTCPFRALTVSRHHERITSDLLSSIPTDVC